MGASHQGSPLDEFQQAIADASWAVYLPFILLLPFVNGTAKGIVAEMNGPAKLVSLIHATNWGRAPTKSRFIPHALDGQTTYSVQGHLQD